MTKTKGFDTMVHHRDRQGNVIKTTPYSLHISNGGMKYVRDGVEFYPDGKQIDPNQKPIKKMNLERALEIAEKAQADLLVQGDLIKKQQEAYDSQSAKMAEERVAMAKEKQALEALRNGGQGVNVLSEEEKAKRLQAENVKKQQEAAAQKKKQEEEALKKKQALEAQRQKTLSPQG